MIITDIELIKKIQQQKNKKLTVQEMEKIASFTRFNEGSFFGDKDELQRHLSEVVNNLTSQKVSMMTQNKEKFLILTKEEVNHSVDIKVKSCEEIICQNSYFVYKLTK